MEEKFYLVEARFGHVGRKYYIVKTVSVKAENGKEAAAKVRMMPRVKHHMKNAIESVKEVSEEEFLEIKEDMSEDMYFKCTSRQEQDLYCGIFENRLSVESEEEFDPFDTKALKEFKYQRRKLKQMDI